MKRTLSRGFTLLEVLLVCIILSFLSATAAVSYGRFVERAKEVEALQNLAAIRTAQLIYYGEHDRFVEALDAPTINARLDVGITPRYFNYRVTSTGSGTFLAMATPQQVVAGEPTMNVAMNQEGQISFYYPPPTVPGAAPPPGSSGFPGGFPGGGGSGAGGGGAPGGGGRSGGTAGGGGGGGQGSSGGADNIGIPTDQPTGSGTTTTQGGNTGSGGGTDSGGGTTTTLTYIGRGSEVWTNWADRVPPSIPVTGTIGKELLTEAINIVAASGARAITDDLARKGIGILFGSAADFPDNGDDTVTVAFFDSMGGFGFPTTPVNTPVIRFNPIFANESPGVLAATVVHEGSHAQQLLDGTLYNTSKTVIDIEFPAWWNAAVYWQSARTDQAPYDTFLEQANETALGYALRGEAALKDHIAALYL